MRFIDFFLNESFIDRFSVMLWSGSQQHLQLIIFIKRQKQIKFNVLLKYCLEMIDRYV